MRSKSDRRVLEDPKLSSQLFSFYSLSFILVLSIVRYLEATEQFPFETFVVIVPNQQPYNLSLELLTTTVRSAGL